MKVSDGTISLGYVQIERCVSAPKSGILLLGNSSLTPYEIGRIIGTEYNGLYALYPSHVGMNIETKTQKLTLLPKREIVAFVEPEEDEEFIPLIQYNELKKGGGEWIGK